MSTEQRTFLIAGAGLAGATAAEALRTLGFTGRAVLLGEENEHPYNRPPLSKDYLQGKSELDKIYLHPKGWYAEHDIDPRLNTRVTGLDLAAHHVNVAGGERIGYDKLLPATGSSPRRLSVPGAELDGVHYLRSLADCDVIKSAFRGAYWVVIVRAGWIGLETAAAARAAGCEVTVIEMAELPLLAVLGRELAEIYAALYRAHGVTFHLDTKVAAVTGTDGTATGVQLGDGSVIDADAAVVGVGITANTALRRACTSTTASSSTSTWPPPTPMSWPPGTLPTPTTRTCKPTCGSSTGRPRSTSHRWPQPLAGPRRDVRQGALLLLRPVRDGQGVLRLRRERQLRRPGPCAATWTRASTSPSGYATDGC